MKHALATLTITAATACGVLAATGPDATAAPGTPAPAASGTIWISTNTGRAIGKTAPLAGSGIAFEFRSTPGAPEANYGSRSLG